MNNPCWLPTVSPIPGVSVNHIGFFVVGDTIHFVYRDGSTAKYRRSEDAGLNWTTAVTIATGIEEVPLTKCIAVDGNVVYVLCSDDIDDGALPPKLILVRSLDGGDTWEAPQTIEDGTSGIPIDDKFRVSIVAKDGKACIFYTNNESPLYIRRSTDYGDTWSARSGTAVSASTQASRPDADHTGDTIYVVWTDMRHGSTANGGEVYINRSEDFGVTWETEQRRTTTPNQDTLRSTVAADGQNVVIGYQWPIFTEDVWVQYSTDGGDTWSSDIQITTTNFGEHASLAVQDGIFAICYGDRSVSPDRTRVRISEDGGATWKAEITPYVPSADTASPLITFGSRFLYVMDNASSISGGTKIIQAPVFLPDPVQTTLLDDFNRANDSSPPPGANWTNGVLTFGAGDGIVIVSNQACRRSSGGFRQGGYYNAATPGPDKDIVAEVSAFSSGTNESIGIFGRLTDPGSGTHKAYTIQISDNGSNPENWSLWRVDPSASPEIAAALQSIAAGSLVCLMFRDDLIVAWHKASGGSWQQIVGALDSNYDSSGFVGLEFTANQNSKITNLWATTIEETSNAKFPQVLIL